MLLRLIKGLPGVPETIEVEFITRDAATIRWTKPHNSGGVPLSGYIVEQQDGTSGRWKVVGYADPYRLVIILKNILHFFT